MDKPCKFWNDKEDESNSNANSNTGATDSDSHSSGGDGMCTGAPPEDDPFGIDPFAPPPCALETEEDVPPPRSPISFPARQQVSWQPFSSAVDRSISMREDELLKDTSVPT